MANEEKLLDKITWVILLEKKEAEAFKEDYFRVVHKVEQCFNPDYILLQIESQFTDCEYTAEDVLIETGAIAVHEEFTNGVIITPDGLDILSDEIYTWNGSGTSFLGDMLTDMEKLDFLMKYIYTDTKEEVGVNDITVSLEKDGPRYPVSEHLKELFDGTAYSAFYKDKSYTIWWGTIVEDTGLFLVVLDEELAEDEDDAYESSRYPLSRYYGYDDYDWGSPYDDYDYDDRYYRRT